MFGLDGDIEVRALDATMARITQRLTEVVSTNATAGTTETQRTHDVTIGVTDSLGLPPTNTRFSPPTSLTISGRITLLMADLTPDTLVVDVSTVTPLVPDDRCLLSGYRAGELRGVAIRPIQSSLSVRYSCQ